MVYIILEKTSRLPGFYKLTPEERLRIVAEWAGLTDEEVKLIKNYGNLGKELANARSRMLLVE